MITRIRLNNKVVGYRRIEGNYELFSKDLYGWNGTEINYNQSEKSSIYKDKNAQVIFENDVLEIKNKKEENGLLYYVLIQEDSLILKAFNTNGNMSSEVLTDRNYTTKKIGYLEQINQ